MTSDPKELDEDVDLDLERRHYVLDVYGRLGWMTHYDLLGVPRGAEKKAIKQAVFRLASELHPDRYYGKRLGSYRAMLETIFAHVMHASDILGDPVSRAEYDAELGPVSDQELPPPVPVTAPSPPPSSVRAPATDPDVERRRRLAREALKSRFGDASSRNAERARMVKRHVDAAAMARAAGDLEAAAESLRLASSLAPEDASLREAHALARRAANERLAESHERQALLEERYGHWAQAAVSWQHVLAAHPDHPDAKIRLAQALERVQRAK